jgi:hypothetical protein
MLELTPKPDLTGGGKKKFTFKVVSGIIEARTLIPIYKM